MKLTYENLRRAAEVRKGLERIDKNAEIIIQIGRDEEVQIDVPKLSSFGEKIRAHLQQILTDMGLEP